MSAYNIIENVLAPKGHMKKTTYMAIFFLEKSFTKVFVIPHYVGFL